MPAPSEDLAALRQIVARELREPIRPGPAWLAQQIASRHPEAVLGVLFYGSCLRAETDEGVLDFWVVVDRYRSTYGNPLLALANAIAPPNVFYLECEHEGRTLRTKYGVISRRDFARGTALSAWHPYVWARFAQPVRALCVRDEDARTFLEGRIAEAVVTMVGRLVMLLPERNGVLRFSLAAFWQEAFRRTYDSERRPEAEESILSLYRADPERYDAVGYLALRELARRGHLRAATEHPRSFEVELAPRRRALGRLRWRLMRPFARTLGLVRLFKTAFTFGDWVPYVLWKLERHTGRRIELTERQRRHPLVYGWPVILPLIRRRSLRDGD
ncbi:MAG: hypothetical protein H6748_17070 [Spirochaetaceae bacterium]|nr:hypothetical protein [Myxococcales bacterium]MCB9725763.1 hypothetical protein [Spirochaetaceae bacterium]